MERRFWKDKKVLVTGHTGFVGAWLCTALSYMGIDVTGFSLVEEDGSLYDRIKEKLTVETIYGDLRNKDAIEAAIRETNPDVVFHLAAYSFLKACYDDPERAYSSNVMGTMNLLEGLRKQKKPCRMIIASSDKVYQNRDYETYLFKEGDLLGGSDPYSASKTCEDILAQSYFDTYFRSSEDALCIVRPSNILGGGDHNMSRLIPGMYHTLEAGSVPEIRNPDSVRPWQNVLDVVDAYITIAEKINAGCEIFNVGPEQESIKSVGEIAAYVSGLYERAIDVDTGTGMGVKEKQYLGLSIEKIKKELGWKPKRSLEETLDEIYRFYSNREKDTYEMCISQIEDYFC